MQKSSLADIIEKEEEALLAEWKEAQMRSTDRDRMSQSELDVNSHDFVLSLQHG